MACSFGPNHGYYVLVIGRAVAGLGIGLASEAGPLYIAETAPQSQRGALITLFNVAVVGGQVVAAVVSACLSYLPSNLNWRVMLGLGALPALLQLAGFLFLPCSPHWLVMKDRTEMAERVLSKTRKPEDVNEELQRIKDDVACSESGHSNLIRLWVCEGGSFRKAMFLGCLLWFASQFAGINTVMYYGATIIAMSGIVSSHQSETNEIWITVPLFSKATYSNAGWVGANSHRTRAVMQLFGIILCICLIDRLGRRKTTLGSMTLVICALLVTGLGFQLDLGIVSVIGMFGYLFAFGSGLSTMPYAINSEIYPIEHRSLCIAQATTVFWLSNFVVSVTFLTLTETITTHGTFYVYAGILFVCELIVWGMLPELAGVSLEEIRSL